MIQHEESHFIDNILADSRSSGPRLAYADWLRGQGNLKCEEYLRLQCQQHHFFGQDKDFWESHQGWGKRRTGVSGQADDDQQAIGERLRMLENELDSSWLVWVLEDFAVPPGLSERGL